MEYRWRDLRFEAPTGRDDSSILIVDPNHPPGWNVSLRCHPLPGDPAGFQTYAYSQKPAAGATVESQVSRTIGGRPAVVLSNALKLADGAVLSQLQALVLHQGQVLTVTMTSTAAKLELARAAFERLLSSLAWEEE